MGSCASGQAMLVFSNRWACSGPGLNDDVAVPQLLRGDIDPMGQENIWNNFTHGHASGLPP